MNEKEKQFGSFVGLNEHLAMRAMFQFFGRKLAVLPELNNEMLKWGEAKSPEYACLPFKIYVGFCRDLAKAGVNDFFILSTRSSRACRYLDLWEGIVKLLADEGLDFRIHHWGGYGTGTAFRQLKKVMGGPSFWRMVRGLMVYCAVLSDSDKLNNLANWARPRETNFGVVDNWLQKWNKKMEAVKSKKESREIYRAAKAEFDVLPLERERPLVKVALAGDLFKIHEPFFHFDTIRKLNRLGAEVKQPQTFSLMFFGANGIPSRGHYKQKFKLYQEKSKKYLASIPASYIDVGVGEVITELENGAQGIVHFQSFGCMPDIMLRPILDRVAKDFGVPIIHFIRDTHSSDAAYQTRLEAFVDLIKRKEK